MVSAVVLVLALLTSILLQVPELPMYDEKLWDPPFSHGLHQCVKPTARYKGFICCSSFVEFSSFTPLV